jgi:putative FmdB family regulatory protein
VLRITKYCIWYNLKEFWRFTMPIYEYTCGKCKNMFSLLQRIDSSEKDTTCPKCGSKEVKKKFSLFSSPTPKSSVESSYPMPTFSGGS